MRAARRQAGLCRLLVAGREQRTFTCRSRVGGTVYWTDQLDRAGGRDHECDRVKT